LEYADAGSPLSQSWEYFPADQSGVMMVVMPPMQLKGIPFHGSSITRSLILQAVPFLIRPLELNTDKKILYVF
jgi:hypothetical protein